MDVGCYEAKDLHTPNPNRTASKSNLLSVDRKPRFWPGWLRCSNFDATPGRFRWLQIVGVLRRIGDQTQLCRSGKRKITNQHATCGGGRKHPATFTGVG